MCNNRPSYNQAIILDHLKQSIITEPTDSCSIGIVSCHARRHLRLLLRTQFHFYRTEFLDLRPKLWLSFFFLLQQTQQIMRLVMTAVHTTAIIIIWVFRDTPSSFPLLVCCLVGVTVTEAVGAKVLFLGTRVLISHLSSGGSGVRDGWRTPNCSSFRSAITSPLRPMGVAHSTTLWLTLVGCCLSQLRNGRISWSHLQGFWASSTSLAAVSVSRVSWGRLFKELL